MAKPVNPNPVRNINCIHCYTTGGEKVCFGGDDGCTKQILDPGTGLPVPGQTCTGVYAGPINRPQRSWGLSNNNRKF